MGQPQPEVIQPVVTEQEFTDFFEPPAGTSGTDQETKSVTAGTITDGDPGQPGPDTIEAADISIYISTAEAAKLAHVDSRTIRRWHDQQKVRGRFSKGKLLVAKEDLLSVVDESEFCTAGTPGTDQETEPGAAGTTADRDPGQPGQSTGRQTPAFAFIDLVDRIERLSRENGELRAMLDEQRRENEHLKLLTDSQHRPGWWVRVRSWFKA